VGFTAAQAARLTGCTLPQLSSWEGSGLVTPPPGPAHRYRHQDLVALRVVASLLEAGLGLDRVRRAVRYVVDAADDDPPRALVTDGETVWACRDDRQVLDALRDRPVALVVAVDRIGEDVAAAVRAFDAEREAFVQGLHDAEAGTADVTSNGGAVSGRAADASARAPSHRRATRR
jgi:DNA-binding transcriptional MerR regulator